MGTRSAGLLVRQGRPPENGDLAGLAWPGAELVLLALEPEADALGAVVAVVRAFPAEGDNRRVLLLGEDGDGALALHAEHPKSNAGVRVAAGPGQGRVIRRGRKVIFLEGELFDEAGKLLARATSTAIPTPRPGGAA